MKSAHCVVVSALASSAAAHGYIKWIGIDNRLYPGWNPHVDAKLGAKRIAFGQAYANHPRYAPSDVTKPEIACGRDTVPAQLQAEARAGSNVTFGWSTWPETHNGPSMTYMARYDGDISKVNANTLEFFKIAELGLSPDGKTWATQILTANDNVTTVTIPHDLVPGNYIIRHELITLHFATEDSRYYDAAAKEKGAQHFMTCFNIKLTGTGTAKPPGVRFPGAYKPRDPGIYFDIYRNITPYPIPGPPLYRAVGPAPKLSPNKYEVSMPMNDLIEDMKYFNHMYVQAWQWDGQTFKRNNDSRNGWEDGPNPKMSRACTVQNPCKEDMGGKNPSYEV